MRNSKKQGGTHGKRQARNGKNSSCTQNKNAAKQNTPYNKAEVRATLKASRAKKQTARQITQGLAENAQYIQWFPGHMTRDRKSVV